MKYLCLLAAMLSGTAWAQQWFTVANPDSYGAGLLLEVDLETVHARSGGGGDGVIRVTFDVLQPHSAGFGFRSFVATAQFDCQKRAVVLVSAAYFALPSGQGMRVGSDSAGRESGMPASLIERVPLAVRHSLLRATCGPNPPSPEPR